MPVIPGISREFFVHSIAHGAGVYQAWIIERLRKANGINPEKDMDDLLTILPEQFAQDPKASIEDLMPWAVEMKNQFSMQRRIQEIT